MNSVVTMSLPEDVMPGSSHFSNMAKSLSTTVARLGRVLNNPIFDIVIDDPSGNRQLPHELDVALDKIVEAQELLLGADALIRDVSQRAKDKKNLVQMDQTIKDLKRQLKAAGISKPKSNSVVTADPFFDVLNPEEEQELIALIKGLALLGPSSY